MNKLKYFNLYFFKRVNCTSIKNKFIIFFALLFFNIVFSQKTQVFKIPDSLKNKTYKELINGYDLNLNHIKIAKLYTTTYLNKAKNENDTINIASAYSQLAYLESAKNIKTALKYADSIITYTQNSDNYTYPAHGYLLKGVFNRILGNYENSLESLLIGLSFATKNTNIKQLFYVENEIGELKYFWGNYNEAIDIFKDKLNLIQDENFKIEDKPQLYLSTLFRLSNAYILTKKYDSALIYSKKGLEKSLQNKDSIKYYNFVFQTGSIAYHQNKFEIALDSLNKSFPFETTSNGLLNAHYYFGNIYNKLNNSKKAFYHFSKADSIYNATQDVVPEVRDIQEYFVNYYKINNDTKNQLKFINRLLYVDSIINKTNKNINETIITKYDIPKLLSEKQKIISKLKTEEKKSSTIIYALISIVIFIILYVLYFTKMQLKYKKRFNKLLTKQKKSEVTIINNNVESNSISKEIFDAIILELDKFEDSKGFLNNKITLKSLALLFNTNTTYLSKCINLYKKKNYSTYITDLRINYCFEKLKNEETYRKYTIKAIASEVGFNNVESFSKAFYKKTKIYPSFYIKELIAKNDNKKKAV